MAQQELIPYSFNTKILPTTDQPEPLPGQYQGIHFTIVDPQILDELLEKIRAWFSRCNNVIIIDHGTTASGLGFIVMEWEYTTVNPLFLAILEHDQAVNDHSVYTRDEEV